MYQSTYSWDVILFLLLNDVFCFILYIICFYVFYFSFYSIKQLNLLEEHNFKVFFVSYVAIIGIVTHALWHEIMCNFILQFFGGA